MPLRPAEALVPADRVSGDRATLALASVAVLLGAADTYVVVLALPDMMLGVHLGIDELQRATPIVSAFLLGYVATLPLIGRLADLRGCRPVLAGCLLLFALGCLVTAGSTDLGTLIAGRALQGVGGGGLVPATLALVAEGWPAERRGLPLGVVGAVQETGAVLGPLAGAAVLATAGWRAIFWANLAAATVIAAGLAIAGRRARGPWRPDRVAATGAAVAVVALALFLLAPAALVQDVTLGLAWTPLAADHAWSEPLLVLAVAAGLLALTRAAARSRPRELAGRLDAAGSALLALALAGVVLTFATADPERSAMADEAPLLLGASAVLLAGFAIRQRTARRPLIPPGTLARPPTWGALLVNLLAGAALVAALVDIPVFARATSAADQVAAAMVLVRLLVAVPVGALAGGWATRRLPARVVAAVGLLLAAVGLTLMTRWTDGSLSGARGIAEPALAGLGFGLAIAPVNAVLLAATDAAVHGVASALVVVARMVGMLAGLSVLTAVGLRVFYAAQQRIGTPVQLCPASPVDCPAYASATHTALLSELHVIFAGAAGCAAAGAVLALALLGPGPPAAGGSAQTGTGTGGFGGH